jgi:alpha-N-arabinofuranosidase
MLKLIDECELRTDREIMLAMDEWNIRHFLQVGENSYRLLRNSPRNLQDALFAAGILNMMIGLSPRIGMANYVFLINSNGVINVSPSRIVKTPLFYVFQQYARWMRGTAVEAVVSSPECIAPLPQLNHPLRRSHYPPKKVGYLDAAAACHEDGTLVISLINRHQSEQMQVKLVLPDGYGVKEQWTLHHSHIYAANDFHDPDQVTPVMELVREPIESIACPAHSLILVRCTRNGL